MGRPKGSGKKGKFDDLDQDFKTMIENATDEEIRLQVAKAALDNAALKVAKEDDEDLKDAVEAAKEAGAVYRKGDKMNNLRIKFGRMVLGARCKENGDAGLDSIEDAVQEFRDSVPSNTKLSVTFEGRTTEVR